MAWLPATIRLASALAIDADTRMTHDRDLADVRGKGPGGPRWASARPSPLVRGIHASSITLVIVEHIMEVIITLAERVDAVLSLAGIGFDPTRLKVVADPALVYNTHFITIRGSTGNICIKLESVPAPENPKTAWLACYSALAALKQLTTRTHYGA